MNQPSLGCTKERLVFLALANVKRYSCFSDYIVVQTFFSNSNCEIVVGYWFPDASEIVGDG